MSFDAQLKSNIPVRHTAFRSGWLKKIYISSRFGTRRMRDRGDPPQEVKNVDNTSYLACQGLSKPIIAWECRICQTLSKQWEFRPMSRDADISDALRANYVLRFATQILQLPLVTVVKE